MTGLLGYGGVGRISFPVAGWLAYGELAGSKISGAGSAVGLGFGSVMMPVMGLDPPPPIGRGVGLGARAMTPPLPAALTLGGALVATACGKIFATGAGAGNCALGADGLRWVLFMSLGAGVAFASGSVPASPSLPLRCPPRREIAFGPLASFTRNWRFSIANESGTLGCQFANGDRVQALKVKTVLPAITPMSNFVFENNLGKDCIIAHLLMQQISPCDGVFVMFLLGSDVSCKHVYLTRAFKNFE